MRIQNTDKGRLGQAHHGPDHVMSCHATTTTPVFPTVSHLVPLRSKYTSISVPDNNGA